MDKTMVSVPVEPTDAMIEAAQAVDNEMFAHGAMHGADAGQIYRAMLSAAPAPQPVQGEAVAWRVRPHDTDISAARVINDARLAESMAAHRWLVEPLTELPTPAESQPQGGAVRELVRRLYVELLWCDRQCASKGMTQGVSVRDVLADSLAYLESTPKPTPAVQIAASDHIADARKMVAAPGDVEQRARELLRAAQRDMGVTFFSPVSAQEQAALRAITAALRSQGQANKEQPPNDQVQP